VSHAVRRSRSGGFLHLLRSMEAQTQERCPFRRVRRRASIPVGLVLGLALIQASPCLSDDEDGPDRPVDTTSIAPADFSDADVPHDGPAPVAASPDRPARLPETIHAPARPAHKLTKNVKGAKKRKAARRGLAEPGIVDIPAGCFRMGSPDSVGADNEHPRHEVCVEAFRLDRLPVLQAQFEAATGFSPWSLCEGANCAPPDLDHPAWYVTWNEADSFCRAKKGRLPTEAEYEYAARAGDSGLYIWGDSLAAACDYANLADLSLSKALPGWVAFPCSDGYALVAPAGGRKPNRWGLYDMAGNVWEWTSDWYAADWYSRSPEQDPIGPAEGTGKVMRGGSWLNGPTGARASYRDGFHPAERYSGAIGFRCAYPAR
jgi:formylglycine-generating enzyme required for sulfatase activity